MPEKGISRSELVQLLNELPDVEVGTDDGVVVHAELSSYDAGNGEVPYIHLTVEDV